MGVGFKLSAVGARKSGLVYAERVQRSGEILALESPNAEHAAVTGTELQEGSPRMAANSLQRYNFENPSLSKLAE
jgi:hypothetical protein